MIITPFRVGAGRRSLVLSVLSLRGLRVGDRALIGFEVDWNRFYRSMRLHFFWFNWSFRWESNRAIAERLSRASRESEVTARIYREYLREAIRETRHRETTDSEREGRVKSMAAAQQAIDADALDEFYWDETDHAEEDDA